MEIEKQIVSSSNVEAIGYDDESKTLRIWFIVGTIYDYANFSKIEFEAFINAPSIGSYFNRNIKGLYSYIKIG